MEKKRPTEDTERKYDLQKGIREVEATNLQYIGLSSFVRFFRSRGSINNDTMSFEGSPGHHKRIFHCVRIVHRNEMSCNWFKTDCQILLSASPSVASVFSFILSALCYILYFFMLKKYREWFQKYRLIGRR